MRTIAHISDLHFGRDDPPVVEGLLADLEALRPDVVVASGDFTQRARCSQYAAAAAFIRQLPVPPFVVPGNHDIPMFDVIRRFLYPLNRYRQYISSDVRPFYRDGELAILGINTARSWHWSWSGFWKDGRISEEQLLDVKLRLGEVPEPTFKVVVTHHPFIPPPGERRRGIVGGASRALAIMEACGVDMLLAGHLHLGYSGDVRIYHAAVKRSILSIQAGTAISTRRRTEPNAYNLIRIDPPRVSIDVRTWQGSRFATSAMTRYARVDDVWRREMGED